MNITLYSAFNKRYNSTLRPSGGTSKSVVLKEETSVEKPSFLVSNVDWTWNYASWGGRYYYVTDITSEGNNLFRVDCDLDVLATYKSEIGSYTAYVTRSASDYDLDIKDTLYPAKIGISETAMTSTVLNSPFVSSMSAGTYVVGTVGRSGSGQSIYIMNNTTFGTFCSNVFPTMTDSWSMYLATSVEQAVNGGITNILQYIAFIRWLPLSYASVSAATTTVNERIWLGGFDTLANANRITGSLVVSTASQTVQIIPRADPRGNWLELSPFAEYELQAGPFGLIKLDDQIIENDHSFTFRIYVHILSGVATLVFTDPSTAKIAQYDCNIAFDVKAGGGTSNVLGLIGGAVTAGVSAAVGDFAGAAAGIASSAAAAIPKAAQMGGNTNGIPPLLAASWSVSIKYWTPADEDLAEFGRPLMQYKQISSLSGYVQCYGASCPISGREADKQEVNTFLNSGFFYE